MSDIIVDCLSNKWAMFYTRSMSISSLTSLQTLEKSLMLVNQHLDLLGKNLDQWDTGMQDEICRLLWVNWIYQRLAIEPIRKPILTHYQVGSYYVDCGDTRLMSLRLYDPTIQVPVISTCSLNDVAQFDSWSRIHNSDELKAHANFGPDACVLATPAKDWCLYWLEIGDHTTAHHLHSINQRLAMIQQYINQQSDNFRFSEDWMTSLIDWTEYQTTD